MIILLVCATIATAPIAGAGTITDRLRSKLPELRGDQVVPIIVTLARKPDPFSLRRGTGSVGGMIRSLRESADREFRGVADRLGGGFSPATATLFWINQTIGMSAGRDLIERLARDPAVVLIEEDEADFFAETFRPAPAEAPSAAVVPWNLTITGVDSVWEAYGLDGTGVVIGLLDTGIDTSHPALHGKLRLAEAWKDFIFGQPAPYDNQGHGTFGAGILAGGGGASGVVPGIGAAFRSRLVVGKILDAGASTISQVTTGMQWILDPDGDPGTDDFPRVVNNSWFSGTRGSTYAYAAASAWRAAGIIPVFCAGNSGPSSGTTRSPGDYRNCISVGGTDSSDDRYNNTSVGPSPPDTNFFPADGRKPDLSAPGEAVYSSQQGGGYGYSSGTSWSSPHVAATIALMLQANHTLDYDRALSILRLTAADAGTDGYDHVFGYGRISAMGAVTEALRARFRIEADAPLQTTETGGTAGYEIVLDVMPRDTVLLTLTVSDTSEGSVSPAGILFTSVDWNIPRQVTVTGRDDSAADGDVAYSIVMASTSADPLYDGTGPAPVTIENEDDEDAVVVGVNAGWNLVSLPTVTNGSTRAALFPTALSPAYSYDGGYVAEDTLRPGAGYWLRFGEAATVRILGDTASVETVSVSDGWNLIGSVTAPVPVPAIVSDPPGLAISRYFGYDTGYRAAETIEPGKGYWVKISGEGILIMGNGTTGLPASAVRISGP